jgi:hypothetical protein
VALPEWVQVLGTVGFGTVIGTVGSALVARSGVKLTGRDAEARLGIEVAHREQLQETDLRSQEQRLHKEHEAQKERLRTDLAAQKERLGQEQEHERAMLAQAAHFEVRKEMAERAGRVMDWLTFEALSKFGHEVDMFPAETPGRPYDRPGDAVADLRSIAVSHPTKEVRRLAARLSDAISGVYNSLTEAHPSEMSQLEEPDSDMLLGWGRVLGDLIELINDPPGIVVGTELSSAPANADGPDAVDPVEVARTDNR